MALQRARMIAVLASFLATDIAARVGREVGVGFGRGHLAAEARVGRRRLGEHVHAARAAPLRARRVRVRSRGVLGPLVLLLRLVPLVDAGMVEDDVAAGAAPDAPAAADGARADRAFELVVDDELDDGLHLFRGAATTQLRRLQRVETLLFDKLAAFPVAFALIFALALLFLHLPILGLTTVAAAVVGTRVRHSTSSFHQ